MDSEKAWATVASMEAEVRLGSRQAPPWMWMCQLGAFKVGSGEGRLAAAWPIRLVVVGVLTR